MRRHCLARFFAFRIFIVQSLSDRRRASFLGDALYVHEMFVRTRAHANPISDLHES